MIVLSCIASDTIVEYDVCWNTGALSFISEIRIVNYREREKRERFYKYSSIVLSYISLAELYRRAIINCTECKDK